MIERLIVLALLSLLITTDPESSNLATALGCVLICHCEEPANAGDEAIHLAGSPHPAAPDSR
jgi:hypothetical protein